MSAVVSSSKIPVAAHRRPSNTSSHGSPERNSPAVAVGTQQRKESPPSKIPTPATTAKERPQSIDIEDEFKNTLQYTRLIATLQKHQELPLSPEAVVSPVSRIPVAGGRKLSSTESPYRSSSESSPAKSRRNGGGGGNGSGGIGASTENYAVTTSIENINSSSCDDSPVRSSKIPTLKGTRSSSPPKKQPTFGWSLSPERMLPQTSPTKRGRLESPERQVLNNNLTRHNSSSASSVSSSTATSRTTTNKSFDSATEQLIGDDHPRDNNYQQKSSKQKQYEAFVMTGDRMICLAKTPANADFKTAVNHRQQIKQPVPFSMTEPSDDDLLVPSQDEATRPNEPSPPPPPPPRVRQADNTLRNSSSEDQLLLHSNVMSSDLLDDISGSADALLGSSSNGAGVTGEAASYSNSRQRESIISKNSKKASLRHQSSIESSPGSKNKNAVAGGGGGITTHSPSLTDFSTSSLISSEHYNGESLLDHDNLSPQTSSSPDTPEWSLMDSFHKQRNNQAGGGEAKAPLLPIASADENSASEQEQDDQESMAGQDSMIGEAIKSDGNRVIITIGTTNNASSTYPGAAVEADHAIWDQNLSESVSEKSQDLIESPGLPNPQQLQNFPSFISSTADSSEESDLESLRSYHPPARPIDIPSAERLAKRLFYLDGFKRTDVSRHLGKNNEFSQVVAEEYLRYFDFSGGLYLDAALRRFLQHFCLTGETQERERVLLHFSKRYLECNPDYVENPTKQLFRSLDAVHTLTCAIMLLNTDLHGDSVQLQRKMTCNEFIENLRDLNDGQNFPRDLLRSIYYSIKEIPVPWAAALDEMAAAAAAAAEEQTDPVKQVMSAFSDAGGLIQRPEDDGKRDEQRGGGGVAVDVAANLALGKTGGGINPFITLPDPLTAVDFKKGYVMRKCCVDSHGKKTKLGKRSWRMFFVTLRDMVVYCFKDEKTIRQPGAFDDFSAAIRIHHGLAVRASDYTKKQFVFRLHTADRAEYLFQTSDEKELLTWIDAINYVVSTFSAPQLPAPCSNSNRFQRPLMPSAKSSLAMTEQLSSHESQLGQLRSDFEELLQSEPAKHAKSTVWQNYKEKEEFLQFEIMRYETYILTLRTKNAQHDT